MNNGFLKGANCELWLGYDLQVEEQLYLESVTGNAAANTIKAVIHRKQTDLDCVKLRQELLCGVKSRLPTALTSWLHTGAEMTSWKALELLKLPETSTRAELCSPSLQVTKTVDVFKRTIGDRPSCLITRILPPAFSLLFPDLLLGRCLKIYIIPLLLLEQLGSSLTCV